MISLNHANAVLIPVINTESPDFIFGLKDAAPKEKLEIFNYSVNKNLSVFRTMSQFEPLGFTEEDAVSYSVTVQDYIFNLGDKLSLDEGALYISSVNLKLKGSVLDCTYTLSTKNALSAKRIFNNITGLALSGTVLKAIDDTVKVHLHIDGIDGKQDVNTCRVGGSPAYPTAVFSKNSFHYTDFGDRINFLCVASGFRAEKLT